MHVSALANTRGAQSKRPRTLQAVEKGEDRVVGNDAGSDSAGHPLTRRGAGGPSVVSTHKLANVIGRRTLTCSSRYLPCPSGSSSGLWAPRRVRQWFVLAYLHLVTEPKMVVDDLNFAKSAWAASRSSGWIKSTRFLLSIRGACWGRKGQLSQLVSHCADLGGSGGASVIIAGGEASRQSPPSWQPPPGPSVSRNRGEQLVEGERIGTPDSDKPQERKMELGKLLCFVKQPRVPHPAQRTAPSRSDWVLSRREHDHDKRASSGSAQLTSCM